jgi:transcriptional regulator with XRE-family HTH domain
VTTIERPSPFAQALTLLVNGMHPPRVGADGVPREISDRDLADRINQWVDGQPDGLGRTVTHAHLAKLRRGPKPNPSYDLLRTFAGYFGVSLDTFDDPVLAAERAKQLAFINTMRARPDVVAVLLRGNDEETRRAVESLLDVADVSERDDERDDGRE